MLRLVGRHRWESNCRQRKAISATRSEKQWSIFAERVLVNYTWRTVEVYCRGNRLMILGCWSLVVEERRREAWFGLCSQHEGQDAGPVVLAG